MEKLKKKCLCVCFCVCARTCVCLCIRLCPMSAIQCQRLRPKTSMFRANFVLTSHAKGRWDQPLRKYFVQIRNCPARNLEPANAMQQLPHHRRTRMSAANTPTICLNATRSLIQSSTRQANISWRHLSHWSMFQQSSSSKPRPLQRNARNKSSAESPTPLFLLISRENLHDHRLTAARRS